jgi:hypothetical protein
MKESLSIKPGTMAKSPRTREEQDEEDTKDPSLFVCLEACQSFRRRVTSVVGVLEAGT